MKFIMKAYDPGSSMTLEPLATRELGSLEDLEAAEREFAGKDLFFMMEEGVHFDERHVREVLEKNLVIRRESGEGIFSVYPELSARDVAIIVIAMASIIVMFYVFPFLANLLK